MMNQKNKGYAIDAGFSYDFLENSMNLSMSLVDFGSIGWQDDILSYSTNGKSFTYKGVEVKNFTSGDSTSFHTMADSIKKLFELKESKETYRSPLTPKMYVSTSFHLSQRTSLGLLFYSEFYNGLKPAFTFFYEKKFAKSLGLSLSYSAMSRSYSNFGIGAAYKLGPVKVFAATDNLAALFAGSLLSFAMADDHFTVLVPEKAQTFHIRAGLNIVIDKPVSYSRSSIPF